MSDFADACHTETVSEAEAPSEHLGKYAGTSGEQRRAKRRRQLIDAGIEVFGTVGWTESTVRGICSQAGLTERYFYESFRDREDLMFAVVEDVDAYVMGEALKAALAAEHTVEARARAGLGTYFRICTGDARFARVISFESVAVSERVEAKRREIMHNWAGFFVAQVIEMTGNDAPAGGREWMWGMSLVGATNELLVEWVGGRIKVSVDELIDHAVNLYMTAAHAAVHGAPKM
jgi:AcrR family transcriptional regulator